MEGRYWSADGGSTSNARGVAVVSGFMRHGSDALVRRTRLALVVVAFVALIAHDGLPSPAAADVALVDVVAGPIVETDLARATTTPKPRHVFPVLAANAPYTRSHHDYPATDVPVPCGTPLVAATDGVIWEVQRLDRWNRFADVPSTRGGRTVVIDGDDGARYLYAHFSTIVSTLAVGDRVSAGDPLGAVGTTGRSTGCHLHLGLSPQCPGRIWDLLAGTIWPWPYLDAWRAGNNIHPGAELAAWVEAHPGACGGSAVIERSAGLDQGPNLEALPG